MEARTVSGQHYSRNSSKAIRAGLEQYLTQAPHRKAFSIIHESFCSIQRGFRFPLKKFGEDGGFVIYKTQASPRTRRCGAVVYGEAVRKRHSRKSSDCLVLFDALLWQARPRKPEKHGKGRYSFPEKQRTAWNMFPFESE